MEDNITKEVYKFIVSGDSISKGVVLDEEKNKYVVLASNYVTLLQEKLKGIIHNTSRFGNTITRGISKLKHDILKDGPDVVLIEYGGNDCDFNWDEIANNPCMDHDPKTDLNAFESMLKDTIKMLKSNNIVPVLMTLPPLNADKYLKWVSRNNPLAEINILKWLGSVTKIYWWHERYNSAIIKIAEETRTRWIDIRGAFLQHPDFTKYLCNDGIHPNEDGHKLIADKIIDFVKSNYDYLLIDNV